MPKWLKPPIDMRILLPLLLFVFYSFFARAQSKSNRMLLAGADFSKPRFEQKRKVTYLFKDKNWFIKYNPVSAFFGGSLMFYQKFISVQLGANCPYEVSCSAFSKQCIGHYGLIKGIALTADRLTRCTRMAAIDIDEETDMNKKTGKIYDSPQDYSFKNRKP